MSASRPNQAVFLHSPDLDRYNYPPDCPFSARRAGITRRILASMGLLSGANRREVAPSPAPRDILEKFHTARYLDVIRSAERGDMGVEGLEMGLGTPETPVFVGMYDYAALACGATLNGADLVDRGDADVAFNPSGGFHHAGPERASGFCYVNDVALACLVLAARGNRVFFLDVDVHHGDGVQAAFYGRRDVLTMSFHESGKTLFPHTGFEDEIGVGDGLGYSVNVPLPAGTYDAAYLKAFRAVALPILGAYNPDVIVMEIGMDCLAGDPLANLNLTNNAYADVVEEVLAFDKPLLVTGGGGYHPENTARGWALVWCVLCGDGDVESDSFGLGGVMLESTEWAGGLRDRVLAPQRSQRERVDRAVAETIEAVRRNVFAYHGL